MEDIARSQIVLCRDNNKDTQEPYMKSLAHYLGNVSSQTRNTDMKVKQKIATAESNYILKIKQRENNIVVAALTSNQINPLSCIAVNFNVPKMFLELL